MRVVLVAELADSAVRVALVAEPAGGLADWVAATQDSADRVAARGQVGLDRVDSDRADLAEPAVVIDFQLPAAANSITFWACHPMAECTI